MVLVITPKRRRSLRTYSRRDSSSVRSSRSTPTLKSSTPITRKTPTTTSTPATKRTPVLKSTPKSSGDITTPLRKSPRTRDGAAAAAKTPKSQAQSPAANRRSQHGANGRSRTTATKKPGSKPQIANGAIYGSLPLSESTDFSETDDIVDWQFDPPTKSVCLVTHRASDPYEPARLVPESLIQHKAPEKLYAYWASYGQPRQATVGSDFYHILNILAHDAEGSRLKIQWVGYPPSDAETTWEPVAKVRGMNSVLLVDYITRHDPKREIKASLKRN